MTNGTAGRPTKYSKEIADRIIREHSEGKYLTDIVASDDMPGLSTVYDWKWAKPDFRKRLARARKNWAHSKFDEVGKLNDDFVRESLTLDDNRETNDRIRAKAALLQGKSNWNMWAIRVANQKSYGDKQDIRQKTETKHEFVDNTATTKLFDKLKKKDDSAR